MDNALKLRVMFDMIDGITKPLKTMLAGNRGLASSLKDTRRELAELGKTQKNVATFREMHAGLSATDSKLAAARKRVKEMADSLRAFGPPSQQMTADLAKARQAASQLNAEQKKQTAGLQEMRERLAGAGIDTRNLSQHERELRTNIAATTATMTAQMGKLDAISQRERRMAAARSQMQAMQGVAAGMAVGGYAARSTGMHMLGDMRESLDESKKYEIEVMRIRALGLGDHASEDAAKYARAMKVYGTSTTDNVTMMRDALTIFADEHHAQMVMPTLSKMKFANEAMFGAEDAHANEEKFMNMLKVIELRGGTRDEATFKDEANMVQKVLTATGGRVGGDEWRNFIQTGGVAAKQMRKDAFYYQMEPLIQEMGGHAVGTGLMSAYSNVYQGKTTVKAAKQMMALDLLDKNKVEYNKIGMIKQIRPGALAGGDMLKASPLEWLEKVLLPKLAAKGITEPDKVKDMIATIFTNRTAANLFTTMYMQKDQIHKNERLNAGADGIDEANAKGQQLTHGREIAALSKLRDLKLEIGEKISPLYNAGLKATAAATDKVVGFMKEHSTAVRVILVTLAALAALLVVVGTMTIALAGVLGPLAIVKFSMKALGMEGGLLTRALGAGATAWRGFGSAAMFAGRAMLATPIGLAIAAIVAAVAVAALVIRKYWEPIKAFFGGMFDGLLSGLAPIGAALGAVFGALKPIFAPVIDLFAGVWNWFSQLLEPIRSTGAELSAAAGYGRMFGEVLGGALRLVFMPLELLAKGIAGLPRVIESFLADANTAFSGGLAGIAALILNWSPLGVFYQAFAGALSWFGFELPAKFSEFGANILSGLVNGITSGLGAVKDAITGVADSTVGWFKEKLGIHSPSRVFGELGGFIGQGAAIGMESEQGRVAKAAIGLATIAATSFGMPALANGAALAQAAAVPIVRATVPIDTRPPLGAAPAAASAAGNAAPAAFGPITINIYPSAGMDSAEVGRMVRAELERAQRAQQARKGSSLSDS
ncbi:hypothetical protein R69746_04400 [Paraburkholderia aspalathi]|uniref:hypothetical protein n=1 Tax=Paraburkholderia aspalathi TaxID=1324617 RepID=UPI00190DB981|nr:hypothetical protein [Paraburkholderia aspalathi]MBK3840519.1 hypothetical protein [Paraburkholderia aspalathi]CAE6783533.1 hypothetical protein R69746_04400 [Paraburkholderia aspalathi]